MAATPTVISTVMVPAVAQFTGGGQYDLVALADVKFELQITDGLNDAWLAAVISRVSSAISDYCNRIFQVQTYQDMFYAKRDPFPWQVPGGVMPLQLRGWPIVAAISPAGTPPPPAPVLSAVAGGALAAAIYYVRATYLTAAGETAASLESRLAVAANNLLSVAQPPLDLAGLATGWNVYVATAAFKETLQNASPLLLSVAFAEPPAGLIAGAAMPNYVTAVENFARPLSPVDNGVTPPGLPPLPRPLAEGVDFLVDARFGQLSRLFSDGYPRPWPPLPIVVQYQAGFATIPFDLQEAAIRMVKARWYMRTVNPMVRQENVEGVYSATYWFGTGPGAPGDFPVDIGDMLDRNYRVPVIA